MARTLNPNEMTTYSAATRAHAEAKPALDEAIEGARTAARLWAESATRDMIADRARQDFALELRASAPKDTLVTNYANAAIKAADEYKELERLEAAASCDRMLVSRLNDAVTEAAAEARKMADGLADPEHLGNVIYAAASKVDKVLVSASLARLARKVVTKIEAGADLRDAVMEVTSEAMFTVMSFPRHVLANGTGGGRRLEDTAEAVAAAEFAGRIAPWVMGDRVPTSLLTR